MVVGLCGMGAVLLGWLVAALALDPNEMDVSILAATAPSRHHWLGTDPLGRDVLARLLAGTGTSVELGIVLAAAWSLPLVAAASFLGLVERHRRMPVVASLVTIIGGSVLAMFCADRAVVAAFGHGSAFIGLPLDLGWPGRTILPTFGGVALLVTGATLHETVRGLVAARTAVERCRGWSAAGTMAAVMVIAAIAVEAELAAHRDYIVVAPRSSLGAMLGESFDGFVLPHYWWLALPVWLAGVVIAGSLLLIAGPTLRQPQPQP